MNATQFMFKFQIAHCVWICVAATKMRWRQFFFYFKLKKINKNLHITNGIQFSLHYWCMLSSNIVYISTANWSETKKKVKKNQTNKMLGKFVKWIIAVTISSQRIKKNTKPMKTITLHCTAYVDGTFRFNQFNLARVLFFVSVFFFSLSFN